MRFLAPEFEPKLVTTLREGYSAQAFARDALAGIVVGVVAFPLAIAFAIASGVRPEQGFYTAIVAGLAISLFGGSRVQIGGPTGAFVVLIAGVVGEFGYEALAVATLMAGCFLAIMYGLLPFLYREMAAWCPGAVVPYPDFIARKRCYAEPMLRSPSDNPLRRPG